LKYFPLKDWPLAVQQAIYTMKQKEPTATWISRRNTSLKGRTEHEIREAYFGCQMIAKAKIIKGYHSKYMTPNFIPEDQLDSGKQMGDMYFSLLKSILWAADCHEKATKAVDKLKNVTGRSFSIYFDIVIMLFIYMCR
jgi:hypothetical protein